MSTALEDNAPCQKKKVSSKHYWSVRLAFGVEALQFDPRIPSGKLPGDRTVLRLALRLESGHLLDELLFIA
jgi:hypothetical protein